jgi:predicted nucleotidyltransferase
MGKRSRTGCYGHPPSLDELRRKRHAIERLASNRSARVLRVFGSVARGEERPDSDIDFLVDFPRGYDLFAQRLPLAERLAQITGRRLDLIPEHELSRHLREVVLKEAVEL